MKKLLFVLLVLFPVLLFGQAPWIYTSGGYAVSTIHSCPDTTALKLLDTDLNVMVYLRGYVSGSSTGSGWFNSITSAAAVDASNVIDHPDSGVRYVRMVTITSTLTITGEVTFPVAVCDTNAFTTTAETDTVTVSGAAITDKYIVTMRGGTLDAQDTMLMVEPTATGFVLHRPAGGLSGLAYTWIRLN
jgi:hypothetical protein